MNKRGFIFEGIWRWAVINLVTLIHRYSWFISLEIVVDFRKLRHFQQTQVNLSVLLEKPDITPLLQNSEYGIFKDKLQDEFKDLRSFWKYSISVGSPVFPNIIGDKISLWMGQKICSFIGQGGSFRKFIYQGDHQDASNQGIWTGCR